MEDIAHRRRGARVSGISVVLQGPVNWELAAPDGLPTTLESIRQARRLLPGCEVIVSTWEGEETRLLEADRIVLNKDPGGQKTAVQGQPNNVNRQIASTSAGLKVATQRHTLKLRSDAILRGTSFLAAFDKAPPPPEQFRIFERRIVSNNLSSRNPRAMPDTPLPFHPADHAHYGLRSDLLTLWDVPFQTNDDAEYFLTRERPNHFRDGETSRLTPEQHVAVSAFAKTSPITIRHYADAEAIEASEHLMLGNFVFLKDAEFAIHLAKYHTRYHAQFEWMRYP